MSMSQTKWESSLKHYEMFLFVNFFFKKSTAQFPGVNLQMTGLDHNLKRLGVMVTSTYALQLLP